MFKKTTTEPQLGIFSSPNLHLSGRAENFYEKQDAWHNLFRIQVTSRIDESIFKPLFTEHTGAPNASVRVLVAMMILKEANGWSDQQLFEQCRFNLLVRSALGLMNMDDAVPVESTYYLLRKRIVGHEKACGVNLIEKTFASVTNGQATDFEVSGKSIRMDSKLLGSNIAWFGRYELVHETLRLFCKNMGEPLLANSLPTPQKEVLDALLEETGNKVVYRSTRDEVKDRMQQLGMLAYTLIGISNLTCSKHYETLKRVFSEQFKVENDKRITLRDREDIGSSSVQSPHDPDCHYRDKHGNRVKGYSINTTESCNGEKPNLISGVDVRQVSASDNDFLQDGIEQAKGIFAGAIAHVYADGAYHSTDNREYCKNAGIDLCIGTMPGPEARFDLWPYENGQLAVIDTRTGEAIQVKKMGDKDKWQIKVDGQYRYFTPKHIATSALRRKIGAIPKEKLDIRNNVEATVFQLGYHYPHDKSRYRGLTKHKMWANIRCLWVNFVRILNYVKEVGRKISFWPEYRPISNLLKSLLITIMNLNLFLLKPMRCYQKLM